MSGCIRCADPDARMLRQDGNFTWSSIIVGPCFNPALLVSLGVKAPFLFPDPAIVVAGRIWVDTGDFSSRASVPTFWKSPR